MKKIVIPLLIISLLANVVWFWNPFAPTVDRTPTFHPFEVNPNLTLESLVENGYSCYSMPCGMIIFGKWQGDTLISYQIDVDCQDYSGSWEEEQWQLLELELEEEEMIPQAVAEEDTNAIEIPEPDTPVTYNPHMSQFAEDVAENPYYPFELNEIKGCYQEVLSRSYSFDTDTIDSTALVGFIERYGGRVIDYNLEKNTHRGGSITVYHEKNDLYFVCRLYDNRYDEDSLSPRWSFAIISDIPLLDVARMKKKEAWETKKRRYYYPEE